MGGGSEIFFAQLCLARRGVEDNGEYGGGGGLRGLLIQRYRLASRCRCLFRAVGGCFRQYSREQERPSQRSHGDREKPSALRSLSRNRCLHVMQNPSSLYGIHPPLSCSCGFSQGYAPGLLKLLLDFKRQLGY